MQPARRGSKRFASSVASDAGPRKFVRMSDSTRVKSRSQAAWPGRGRLRDRGGGAEDHDALEAHRVTRRQKLEEKAGSRSASSSRQRGNETRKVSGDMRASFAG